VAAKLEAFRRKDLGQLSQADKTILLSLDRILWLAEIDTSRVSDSSSSIDANNPETESEESDD
jgi:hypothetical protein